MPGAVRLRHRALAGPHTQGYPESMRRSFIQWRRSRNAANTVCSEKLSRQEFRSVDLT